MESSKLPGPSVDSNDDWMANPSPSVNPTGLQEVAASEYLTKHKIMELFENLTSALVYERPDNPKAFAKDFIKKIQDSQNEPDVHDVPSFMDETNLRSIFGMLDITKTGYISREQYIQAMKSLGFKEFNHSPSGGDFDKISFPIFLREGKAAIGKASSTFK